MQNEFGLERNQILVGVLVCLGALILGITSVLFPPAWLTLLAGVAGVVIILARPFWGVVLLVIMLYLPVWPNVELGPLEFSISSLPVMGLAAVALMQMLLRGGKPQIVGWQLALILALAGVFLLTTLTSVSVQKSILFLPNLIIYLLLLFSICALVRTREQFIVIAKVILFAGVAAAIWKEIDGILDLPRLTGLNGIIYRHHAAVAIAICGMLLPLEGFSSAQRRLLWVVFIGLVVDMVLTETRAAWFAAAIVGVIAISQARLSRRLITVLIIGAVGVTMSFTFEGVFERNISATQAAINALEGSGDSTDVVSGDRVRLVARDAGVRMFLARPILGWGPTLFADIKPSFAAGPTRYAIGSGFNSWLVLLDEMGLVGALVVGFAFVTPVLATYVQLRRRRDEISYLGFAFALGVAGLCIHLLFIDLLYSSFVWFHLALTMAFVRFNAERPDAEPRGVAIQRSVARRYE
jgi:O-antigen ligase